MEYLRRKAESALLRMAQQYPVVTITGPRQAGKTTLAKHCFPNMDYVSLESPDNRALAQEDPRRFFATIVDVNGSDGIILDEIQRVPELLSYIQEIVDESDQKGRFILTGSHQLELQEAISQSLAGRTALLKLLPFSFAELESMGTHQETEKMVRYGGFPRIYADSLDPYEAYSYYVEMYLERDLRQIIQVKELAAFQRFMKLCAGRIGQLLNVHSLSNAVGVSGHTINSWLSALQASHLIFFLHPYFENFGKRIVKSPKLYFCDTGLASYLLGIESEAQLHTAGLYGGLFENLAVLELLKARFNAGKDNRFYFFRDHNGREMDVVFERGANLIAIEIKSSQTYKSEYTKNADYFSKLIRQRFGGGYVLYDGKREIRGSDQNMHVLNIRHADQIVL